jgi:hypothetical protein
LKKKRMLKTITITTEITPDREVHLTLPDDTPLGPAEIVVVVAPATSHMGQTFGDLLNSEFFGMWRDRDDIADSAAFARQLRADGWIRAE